LIVGSHFLISICFFVFQLKLGLDPSKGKTGDVDFAHPAAIQRGLVSIWFSFILF
jgi:hypothetical protein